MKKIFKFLFVFVSAVGINQSLLKAEVRYQIDFSSSYIWRGFDLNPHDKSVLQPSIGLDLGQSGLALNFWSSFSFVDRELNEFDLIISYDKDLTRDVSLEAGLIHYGWYCTENFKFKDDTSHEVYLSVSLTDILLEPALSFYYDFTAGDGLYIQLDISHSFPLQKNLDLSLSSSLGYNNGQWLAEDSKPGFSDLNVGLSFPFTASRFQAAVFFSYTIVLLEAIGKGSHFWFGFSVIFEER